MKTKLTTNKIEKLQPEDKQYFVYDDKFAGFGLRVSPGGSKSFFYQGRIGGIGQPKRVTLGKYPLMSLQDAIDAASLMSKQMAGGIDPRRQKMSSLRKTRSLQGSKLENRLLLVTYSLTI